MCKRKEDWGGERGGKRWRKMEEKRAKFIEKSEKGRGNEREVGNRGRMIERRRKRERGVKKDGKKKQE